MSKMQVPIKISLLCKCQENVIDLIILLQVLFYLIWLIQLNLEFVQTKILCIFFFFKKSGPACIPQPSGLGWVQAYMNWPELIAILPPPSQWPASLNTLIGLIINVFFSFVHCPVSSATFVHLPWTVCIFIVYLVVF